MVLAGFLTCRMGSHMSRFRYYGWEQCSHGLTSRFLESCHHQCLKAVCGFLCYPPGAAMELLDGAHKLRCCTQLFTKTFLSPRFYLGWVGLVGLTKGVLLPLVIFWIMEVTLVKGSS